MEPYKPVPVEVARQIAEQYGKSIVIIFAHDPVHGIMHTTTFGADPQNKAWAAQGGEIATKALGGILDESVQFEDYRLQQASNLLAALKEIMRQISIGALVRETASDDAPGWGGRQIPLVVALKAADEAVATAETFLAGGSHGSV